MNMKFGLKTLAVVAAATGALMVSACAPPPGPEHGASPLTCTSGEIPSGTYSEITVTGPCSVGADAKVTVTGNIVVTEGAMLDAQSAPSTITVGHDVTALPGSFLGLGCQPAALVGNSGHECVVDPDGHSTIVVDRNVIAVDAATILINGITVRRSITVLGGGSEIPWSIKNNTVGRDINVSGQVTNWLGVMFNHVGGSVIVSDVTITDTDPGDNGAFVVQNQIRRDLLCYNVTPKVSGGFSPDEVNTVRGQALGQCAALV